MADEVVNTLVVGVLLPILSAVTTGMYKTAARATPQFAEDFAVGFEMLVAAIVLQLGLIAASLTSVSQSGAAPATGWTTLFQIVMMALLHFVAFATATCLRYVHDQHGSIPKGVQIGITVWGIALFGAVLPVNFLLIPLID